MAGFMHINSCRLDPPVASLYEYAFALKVSVLRLLFSFARQMRRSFYRLHLSPRRNAHVFATRRKAK